MTKSKIIISVFFALIIVAMIFWAYPIIKERYFEEESVNNEATKSVIKQEKNSDSDANEEEVDNKTEEEFEKENEDEIVPVEEEEPFLEITLKDCSEKCKKYEKDSEDLEYCRQVCGLSDPKTETGDCAELEGLEENYCWKDQAISKLDFKLCDKISDKNLRRTCINRITEEVLNGKSEKLSLPE